MYQTSIPEKADVIITSCGGYPKDMSLYQGTKTIDNVEFGLKKGGTLVLLAECRDGGGPAEYFDWVDSLCAGTLDADLRRNFTIPGYIFYLNCEQAARYNILMLTTAPAEPLARMGIKAFTDPAELAPPAGAGRQAGVCDSQRLHRDPRSEMMRPAAICCIIHCIMNICCTARRANCHKTGAQSRPGFVNSMEKTIQAEYFCKNTLQKSEQCV